LDPQYAACATGKYQSPIDIRKRGVRNEALPALVFDYRATPLHIVDNGHTIQVNVDPGSSLQVSGDTFELVQFHFHQPSEEKIDGKPFDMVAHLVHRNAQGQLAVVAVLLGSGQPNALLSTLWRDLPHAQGHEASPPHVLINAAALLPQSRGYFTYSGSLTTPPCSQGVRWFVLKSPMTISAKQISVFTRHYRGNARPIQPLNGRIVLSTK
jgi:carbonic anhydrase